MIEDRIEQDIKTAMLARDSQRLNTLRGLKSAILYAKVANGSRDSKLSDAQVVPLLSKEAKKRDESVALYKQGGNSEKAEQELAEKAIIESYLPPKISHQEVSSLVDKFIGDNPDANMGQIISAIKDKTAGSADGAVIAQLVKEKLSQ